ncbi:DinB family protein [Hymenobacter sp. BT507]|uniref:DinB family protein n=1 Tax=Hymenobacter citatus TaxID=2763506 RepID=A0ABR7MK69_9BACT|nr:DinB family protein [Hymenobacter citatus]MBC6611328.1 DinB family protein [Hymenobacter citatus]
MEQNTREALVDHLVSLLTEANAHITFEEACADVPLLVFNKHVPDMPYTIWQLAEHVRIAQWDILEFSSQEKHESPKWPEGYWPARDANATEEQWQQTLTQIREDRDRFIALLRDPAQDLLAPIPHGTGQTLLREALLIADHTAYHTGEIVMMRRLLKNWK